MHVHADTLASKIIILCEKYMNKMKCRNHPLNVLLSTQSGKFLKTCIEVNICTGTRSKYIERDHKFCGIMQKN